MRRIGIRRLSRVPALVLVTPRGVVALRAVLQPIGGRGFEYEQSRTDVGRRHDLPSLLTWNHASPT